MLSAAQSVIKICLLRSKPLDRGLIVPACAGRLSPRAPRKLQHPLNIVRWDKMDCACSGVRQSSLGNRLFYWLSVMIGCNPIPQTARHNPHSHGTHPTYHCFRFKSSPAMFGCAIVDGQAVSGPSLYPDADPKGLNNLQTKD
jgi:hypothetical protein